MGTKSKNELRGLAAARRALKMDQKTVAIKAGLDPSRVSRYESGDRLLGLTAAKALAPVLESDVSTVQFENRRVVAQKAMQDGDKERAVKAAIEAVEIAGDHDLTDSAEAALDDLVEGVLKFAGVAAHEEEDEETYGVIKGEGRDPNGHRVGVKAAKKSRAESPIWGSVGGGVSSLEPDTEGYDPPGFDGRDGNGHRIAPFEGQGADDGLGDEEGGW